MVVLSPVFIIIVSLFCQDSGKLSSLITCWFQGKASKKDLENYLKLANKERNVLERKIALLEKTRQQTGDEKIDNEISALRQQHKELLKNISSKVHYLHELS